MNAELSVVFLRVDSLLAHLGMLKATIECPECPSYRIHLDKQQHLLKKALTLLTFT